MGLKVLRGSGGTLTLALLSTAFSPIRKKKFASPYRILTENLRMRKASLEVDWAFNLLFSHYYLTQEQQKSNAK
ncbi:hypothetical protein L228DRAFT_269159 [Xylona heveae TC161]|uniref:Uncharacterized protein n=1 Tax=Xylona heveae (strain CBS 132557 / TC161) TaxID=1328760 RepID=A0A165G3M7_XYLHT|nr:hypothetical protein L228DRAFT_269159 [Xylona heveae TC161]KZF21701.1 hypothetical protein L228DRAFT_269159 [Xylona heveae TC161]